MKLLRILVVALLCSLPASAQQWLPLFKAAGGGGGNVTIDAFSNGTGGSWVGTNSRTYNLQTAATAPSFITVSSGSTFLLLNVVVQATTGLSTITFTWDSGGTNQAMTLWSTGWTTVSLGPGFSMAWFGLVNPTPGTLTLATNFTTNNAVVSGVSLKGTISTSVAAAMYAAASATGNSTTAAVTSSVSVASGDIAFTSYQTYNVTTFPTDGGTSWDASSSLADTDIEYYAGSGAAVSSSLTFGSSNWGANIVAIAK